MTTLVTLRAIVADEGTVVLFSGVHNELERPVDVVVAVDCRMAQPIADALAEGLQPVVEAEGWQIVGFGGVVAAAPTTLKSTSRKVR